MNKLLAVLAVVFIAIFLKVLMSEEDSVANLLIHSYHPNTSISLESPSRSSQPIRKISLKRNITKLKDNKIKGPESIVPDPSLNNTFYCGTADGRIIKVTRKNETSTEINVETISHVGGRPLGIEFDRNKNLIIAESVKGLVQLNIAKKEVIFLNTNQENGTTRYANDLDISDQSPQIVYFSDSSAIRPPWQFSKGIWNTMRAATLDIASGVSSGRLLAYNTETKEVKELITGIGYANGVALSQNGDFVLVVETARNRILKYSLLDGKTSIFIDNLPYYPDGITRAKEGGFWVAMISPRMKLLDYFHPYKWAKYILFSLPDFVWPQAANDFGLVVRLTENGEVADILEDNSGEVFAVTSVHETTDGKLLLGGLTQDYIAIFDYSPYRNKAV